MNSIKILYVITRFIRGGAQKALLELASAVRDRGFEVLILTGPEIGTEGSLFPELDMHHLPYRIIPALGRSIRPIKDAAATIRLWKEIRCFEPDIIHGHTYKAGLLSMMAGRISRQGKRVISPHGHIFAKRAEIPGVPMTSFRLYPLLMATRFGQRFADAIVTVSPHDANQQINLRLGEKNQFVSIRNGVSFDRFPIRERPDRLDCGMPEKPFRIGTMGRLTREKGHLYLIHAMSIVQGFFPNTKLLIAGTGPERDALEQYAADYPSTIPVEFVGYQEDVAGFLSGLDLFVLPSLYESQGLALIEAMAVGVPVIGTQVGGVRDVVAPSETGTLVPAGDWNRLALAIQKTLQSPRQAVDMARKATRDVRARFGFSRMVAEHVALYQNLYHGSL